MIVSGNLFVYLLGSYTVLNNRDCGDLSARDQRPDEIFFPSESLAKSEMERLFLVIVLHAAWFQEGEDLLIL